MGWGLNGPSYYRGWCSMKIYLSQVLVKYIDKAKGTRDKKLPLQGKDFYYKSPVLHIELPLKFLFKCCPTNQVKNIIVQRIVADSHLVW